MEEKKENFFKSCQFFIINIQNSYFKDIMFLGTLNAKYLLVTSAHNHLFSNNPFKTTEMLRHHLIHRSFFCSFYNS